MPILSMMEIAKGRSHVGGLNLPVPDRLIAGADIEVWQYYAACLPPAMLIHKFCEALDQFHARIEPCRHQPHGHSGPDRDILLSKWNAASILAGGICERFSFELPVNAPAPRDVIAEGLFFLTRFLNHLGDRSAPAWQNRERYYGDLDEFLLQDLQTEFFERQRRLVSSPPGHQQRAP